MSKAFPTDKDNIINDLEDEFILSLSDEEYDCLRKLTAAQLFLVASLLARAVKNHLSSSKIEEEQ